MLFPILIIVVIVCVILVYYFVILRFQNQRNTKFRLYKEKVLKEIELNRPYLSKESQNLIIFRDIYEDGAEVVKCEVGFKLTIEHLSKEEVDRFICLIKNDAYELRKEFSKDKYKQVMTNMICD